MSKKRRFGDRPDGYLVRDADPMHVFFPFGMPRRCDNEASMSENIPLEPVLEYIKKKNYEGIEFKYTFFHVVCAALARTVAERPAMNRFYSGQRLYERNEISFSFTAKKQFTDHSAETLAIVKFNPDDETPPMEQIYSQIKKFVHGMRKEGKDVDGASNIMGILIKIPKFVLNFVCWLLRKLQSTGKYPKALAKVDPYYTTCFISNLGSIKLNAQYHHLSEWGTNSVFMIIGEKKIIPVYDGEGSFRPCEVLPIGITVDERIADGVYFSKTIARLKEILASPEILDEPFVKND